MISKIEALSDRLLAMVVPRARAHAVSCYYVNCTTGSAPVCYRKYCCTGSGIPGGYYCTACARC